jgi:superfamily II DNA/RNA helicase
MVINGQIQLFNIVAKRLTEIREEQRCTIEPRCYRAAELASEYDTSVYWVNFNQESELIHSLDKDSYEIKGSMDIDKKEEILIGFAKGDIKKLVTKAKMTAFGLNWQHCNHTVFFPTFSYEQYYQAIRRFWRFGQKKDVIVDLVYSDGQKRVLDSLMAKTEKANELFTKLNANLHNNFATKKTNFDKQIKLPTFLGSK